MIFKSKKGKDENGYLDEIERQYKIDKRKKKIIFISSVLVVCVGMYGYDLYQQGKIVEVIRMSRPRGMSSIVSQEDFKPKEISLKEYKESVTTLYDKDGKPYQDNLYIKWSDRDEYYGKFYNYMMNEGQEFLATSSSEMIQYRNPLVEQSQNGNEIYTLPIDANEVYTHILYPQSSIRVRVAFEVPISLKSEIEDKVRNKTIYDGSSVVLNTLIEKGYAVSISGAQDLITSTQSEDNRTITISEVIYDELVAIDMVSGSNESIYEVYTALLNIPIKDRIQYLRTSFENDTSGEFRQRVTPSSLIFSLTKEQADRMYEYQIAGYPVKYTIIKKETTVDMLQSYMEINSTIASELKRLDGES